MVNIHPKATIRNKQFTFLNRTGGTYNPKPQEGIRYSQPCGEQVVNIQPKATNKALRGIQKVTQDEAIFISLFLT
jgi:hypothetical protein